MLNWIKHQSAAILARPFGAKTASSPDKPLAGDRLEELSATLRRLEAKVDETLFGLEALRTRSSIYIGQGVALTYLADDTPVYVNSHDFGPPANLLNGGRYEQDNLDVILSFTRDDSIFLDIGANLGFFSLMVARRVRSLGKVHAFEPNPAIARLLRASAYINGLGLFDSEAGVIATHEYGLGDTEADIEFVAPMDHAGGGKLAAVGSTCEGTKFKSRIRRVDDVFDESFVCDLVKIDVEGHEASVLRGMERTIRRSKDIKIVFEKLSVEAGNEAEIESILADNGLVAYAIETGARLRRLHPGELAQHSGYALAAREDPRLDNCVRTGFEIYPRQLRVTQPTLSSLSRDCLHAAGEPSEVLFHGPYWSLRSGIYEFELVGHVTGTIKFSIAGRFGHEHAATFLSGVAPKATMAIERDLIYFECIARPVSDRAEIAIEGIRVRRLA